MHIKTHICIHTHYAYVLTNRLLQNMLELGVAMHNIGKKTKDAIALFKEMMVADPADHLVCLFVCIHLVIKEVFKCK